MMAITIVTAAAGDPVTLTEAKAQLRVTHSSEDTLITDLISAASKYAEIYTGRSFYEQTLLLTLDDFTDSILLPRGRVQSITSVQYVDADGVTQTLATSVYTLDDKSDPQWLLRNTSSTWPTVQSGVNAVSITYVTGETAPADVKHAILMLVAHWYNNRESVAAGSHAEVPLSTKCLLENHRAFA